MRKIYLHKRFDSFLESVTQPPLISNLFKILFFNKEYGYFLFI